MKGILGKIVAVVSGAVIAVCACCTAAPIKALAADEITVIGTVIQTRNYYSYNGDVSAYGFLPAVLSEYSVDGKSVEITEMGAAVAESFGTTDLSGYTGVMRAYKGKIVSSGSIAPYKYTFVLTGVEDIPAGAQTGTADYMSAYLKGLGYNVDDVIEYSAGEIAAHASMNDFTVDFYFYMHGGIWGEINAVVVKPDFSGSELQYMENGQAVGGYAKAQKVAKIFAQYANGTLTLDAAKKALNALL